MLKLSLGVLMMSIFINPVLILANELENSNTTTQNETSNSKPENSFSIIDDIDKNVEFSETNPDPTNSIDASDNTSIDFIDTWMPDKNLQKLVSQYYNVPVNQLTKEMLENDTQGVLFLFLTDNINDKDSEYVTYVTTLEGLQYFNGDLYSEINLYHTDNSKASIDLSYFLNIKTDPNKRHEFKITNYNTDFTNFNLFWDYLNDDGETACKFSLSDSEEIIRNTSLESTILVNNYKDFSINITDFYQKGTPYSMEAMPVAWANETVSDNNLESKENDPTFLTYVYGVQKDIKLIYGVYLVDDKFIFKLESNQQTSINLSKDIPMNFQFVFNHMSPLYRTLLGQYKFTTQINLDINFVENNVGDVVAYYEDEGGNTISKEVTLSGNIGDHYTTEQKEISGYTFKNIKSGSAEITGTFKDVSQQITYVYKKNEEPIVKTGKIIINYVDETGNKIKDSVVEKGKTGESYKTKPVTIPGYTLDEKKLPSNASGIFKLEDISVTYFYKKNTKKDSISKNNVGPSKIVSNYSTKKIENETQLFDILPKTGEGKTIIYSLLGIVILCIISIVFYVKEKNRRQN